MEARRQEGFSLVEVLVAVAVFALLYAGVHGLFTSTWIAWRRNNQAMPLFQVGNGLVDSIVRDCEAAKNTTGTLIASQETVNGITYGNGLKLVLNYPARWDAEAGAWRQKRVTYRNTASGFTRRVETGLTAGENDAWPTAQTAQYDAKDWTLTPYVAQFQYERWNEYASYPRVVRFYLYLHRNGEAAWADGRQYEYRLYGRAWVRRNDANVPAEVSY